MLTFNAEQFFATFERYNAATWPAQWVLAAMAVALVAVIWLRPEGCSRWVSLCLGGLWLWASLAYHLAFFAAINPAAVLFAGLSAVGGALFIWQGTVRHRLMFRPARTARGLAGLALVVLALGARSGPTAASARSPVAGSGGMQGLPIGDGR